MSDSCTKCLNPLSKTVLERRAKGTGGKSGLCFACWRVAIRVHRSCSDCGKAITHTARKGRCSPCANRFKATDADAEARRIANAVAARARVQDKHAAANRQAAARKFAWLPDQYRAEYHRRVKRFGAASARAFIFSQMTPFERQMAKLMSGARLVEVPRMPARELSHSAAGSAAAMMAEAA